MIRGLNSDRGKRFFCPTRRPKGLWTPPQPPIQWITGFFSRIQRRERGVNHSHFSAVIKSEWSCTFTASSCLHGVGNGSFRFNFICLCDYLFVV